MICSSPRSKTHDEVDKSAEMAVQQQEHTEQEQEKATDEKTEKETDQAGETNLVVPDHMLRMLEKMNLSGGGIPKTIKPVQSVLSPIDITDSGEQ